MLKITTQITGSKTTFVLAGKISGLWVAELKKSWEATSPNPHRGRAILDLSDVDFIDEGGKALLGWMVEQGAELRGGGCLVQCLAEEIRSRYRCCRGKVETK